MSSFPPWLARIARWRHRKRGSDYNVLTETAQAQCSTGPINDDDLCTVYQADDGSWWVRKTTEFQDGRFIRVDYGMSEPSADAMVEKADANN